MKAKNNILEEFKPRRIWRNTEERIENILKLREAPCTLWLFFFLFSLLFFLFFSCSSAPKKAVEIRVDRNVAIQQLNLVNQLVSRGRYDDALRDLGETRRLAVSADDPYLRLRTSISRGNILFALGRHDEAFQEWDNSSTEGDASGEPVLASLARIFAIRGRLVLLANETATDAAAEDLKAQVNREMAVVRNDELSSAAGYVTLGLAEKQLGHWAEAESALRRALDIHEKSDSLEDAAYDWFLIGSIRSVAGNYNDALEALRSSISFDRRAENGFGLASSWQAIGDVNQKAGRSQDAQTAWRRAAEIYRAIGLPTHAEKLEEQL